MGFKLACFREGYCILIPLYTTTVIMLNLFWFYGCHDYDHVYYTHSTVNVAITFLKIHSSSKTLQVRQSFLVIYIQLIYTFEHLFYLQTTCQQNRSLILYQIPNSHHARNFIKRSSRREENSHQKVRPPIAQVLQRSRERSRRT